LPRKGVIRHAGENANLGDRAGLDNWVLTPRLGPRNQIWSSPVS